MLDENYGNVLTFDALSKEFYSLKQVSRENVAKFRMCLSQQVQILQSGYPERIQLEHVEEMKWDHFYEGLNPKYQHILAYKVDGKHPISYSDLILAAWKLERWAEPRDSLLLKTTTTGGLNVTWPQTLANLFPSRKLKGNHTFTAQSAIVESIKAQVDLSIKPEGEEETECSHEEDPEILRGIGGADQLVGYIIHFTNVVKLYQSKNWNCFRCGSPDHFVGDCLKDLSKTIQKGA